MDVICYNKNITRFYNGVSLVGTSFGVKLWGYVIYFIVSYEFFFSFSIKSTYA